MDLRVPNIKSLPDIQAKGSYIPGFHGGSPNRGLESSDTSLDQYGNAYSRYLGSMGGQYTTTNQ